MSDQKSSQKAHRLVKTQESAISGAPENNLTGSDIRGASDRNYFLSSAPALDTQIPDFQRPILFFDLKSGIEGLEKPRSLLNINTCTNSNRSI
ncbi:hypothetical protein [Fodinibius roseus]|uniref:hypothetical protein n=1 Tax=Fodinibius roseus TaxID=1194090 RepID=UPI001114F0EA|nr:hypothetical protein [Fodinibius roseus]